jgi:nitric oxide reductase large subunit
LPKYEYCRYWKILGNTGYTSIADTGRFWKILVIPVLQILVIIPVLQVLED